MLSGGEMSIISGSFMFPENASRYSEANISFKLHIADQYSPHDMNVIQVRNTHINVSAQFQYHPDALFTLVVNKEVSPQIIDQWQALADQLGMRMNIWDSSLYHGFSYTRLLHNGRSLAELMKNKVIVILDNNFALDGVFTCSTRLLDEIEMMRAANKFGVATYVIGNMLDLRRSLTPMEPIEEFNQGQLAQKWCLHSNNLTENDTKNIAAEFTTNIQKQNPFVRYVPLYTYQPERDRIATNSFKKRSLGGVEARQTLKLSRAYIAQRNTQTMNPDTLKDAFSILKLLPMNVKLNYLHHANNKLSELSASYAILSDLLDEIKAAARFKWNGGFIEQTLLYCLVNFRHLREGANQVTKHLPYILLNYEYVVCRLTDNYDEYLFPFFRRCIMLKKIILKAVEMQLNEHFANRTFNEERNYIKQQWDKISLDQVFANIVRIPDSTTTFDNQVDFDAPVSLFGLFPKYVKKQSNFQESADLPDNAVQEKKNYTF